MSDQEQLRQQLLELHYGLLSDEEADLLRKRIADDAEVAKLDAEVAQTVKLLAHAARLDAPTVPLAKPDESPRSQPAADLQSSAWSRPAAWTVTIAACLLLVFTLGSYWSYKSEMDGLADAHLRMVVSGPARLQAGVENHYAVRTTTVTDEPVSCEVEYALYAPDNSKLTSGKQTTNDDGYAEVKIPAEVAAVTGSRLEVLAVHSDKLQRVDTRLEVEPIRYAAQLALDKPLYQPGETVYYRSLTLERFSLGADRDVVQQFEILDPSGAVVAGSQWQTTTAKGVASGAFQIPEGQAGGEYTLVARSLDGTFPEEKKTFNIRQYRRPRLKKELEFTRDTYTPGDKVTADFSAERAEGGAVASAKLRVIATVDGKEVHAANVQASANGTFQVNFALPKEIETGDGQLLVVVDDGGSVETIAKTIPINLGKVDVTFYPEGGELISGVENRVYFVARDPLGEPVHVEGNVLDATGKQVAQLKTTYEGMGKFSFSPKRNQTYTLQVTKPAGTKNKPELPAASVTENVVLTTGAGVFATGKSIDLTLRCAKGNLPLVVAAYCRGKQVGEQSLVARRADNPVQLNLADHAGGVIRLTVYDYSQQPPRPVAERLVYRPVDRKLKVRVADHSERYAPADPVELSLIVTDEKGNPVPATLGVSVVDDTVLNLADDKSPSMPTHFLLTTEIEKPEDLEEADFYLSDETKHGVKSAVALDLLLGTQGWRRFVERSLEDLRKEGKDDEELTRLVQLGGEVAPPAMFDNLEEVRDDYQSALSAYRPQRASTMATLSFLGGCTILLLLGMLAMMRLAQGMQFWLPPALAAAASLLVGGFWAGVQGPDQAGHMVAYAPYKIEAVAMLPTDASGALAMPAEDAFEAERAVPLAELAVPQAAAPPPALNLPGQGAPVRQLLKQKEAAQRGEGKGEGKAEAFKKLEMDRPAGKFDEQLRRRDEVGDFEFRQRQAGRFARAKNEPSAIVIREYAHKHIDGPPGVRSDQTEMLFWHPLLLADADGRVRIKFDLNDEVTTFRVRADAHGNGRIGTGSGELISRIPFNLQPKVPLEVNAGDVIDLPLAVVNDTRSELPVLLALENSDLFRLGDESLVSQSLKLGADQRDRIFYPLSVVGQSGTASLIFRGSAGNLTDAVEKKITVVPPGFPKHETYAGQLSGEQEVYIDLPKNWVPGSLEVSLQVFPSTLADIQKGVEDILREPTGCFEQASTSNYPNILALQYMEEHDVASPETTKRAKGLLDRGYKKLIGYECKEKGYEWFGGNAPGHEALTAYGLMEFKDMSQVYDVDQQMVQRTRNWLLARRDGDGSFQRNRKALDSFGRAPQEITDAYIVWALTEAGEKDLDKELAHLADVAGKSDDAYLVALSAASLLNAGQQEQAAPLLDKLTKLQQEDGHLLGKLGSITRSGGHSLKVETTALAALAWYKSPAHAAQANKAIEWLVQSRKGGGFGSTQATILALKALVEHSKANRKTTSSGKLVVMKNDQVLGDRPFNAGETGTLEIDGIGAMLEAGKNELKLTLSGDNEMPYTLNVSYNARVPASQENCPVKLETKLAAEQVKFGESVALAATVTNTKDEGLPMTMAIIGLPAGLEVRVDQLEELKKAGTVDYFELRPREVICYWRDMEPKQKVELKLDLLAAIPGEYIGPASRTYLYYTAEEKQWVDPLSVKITRE